MNIQNSSIWTLLFLSLFCLSCNSSVEKTEGIPTIEIDENDIVPFDEAVSAISFTPLKNSQDTLVNLNCKLWDLFVTDGYLLYATKCNPHFIIHFFDLDGNYIKTFDKQGQGPEEYDFIQGISINEDTLSLSTGAGDIKQYLFPNFEFVGSLELGKSLFIPSIAQISKDKWMISSMFDGNLDENGNYTIFQEVDFTTGKFLDLTIKAPQLANEISEGEIEKVGKSFLLNYAFADTLFLYENNEMMPFVALNFGARHPSQEDLKMDGESFQAAIVNQPMVINMGKIWQTDSISHLKTFGLAKNPELDLADMRTFPIHEVFLDHRTNTSIAFPSLVGWTNGRGDAKDGWFYDILQVDDWINAQEKNLFGAHGAKLEALLSQLENFEDPILIKYQVKVQN